MAFQLSVGSNKWFRLPQAWRGKTGGKVGKVIWGQIIGSPKFQATELYLGVMWDTHEFAWRSEVLRGRHGDRSSRHHG